MVASLISVCAIDYQPTNDS